MRRLVSLAVVSALGMSALIGCSHQQPVGMAPPVNQNSGYNAPQPAMGNGNMAPPVNAASGSVYQWQDVPANQQVPIIRATFDQGGYQIFAQSGETIVVPFANNNMYVMKFGRSSGQNYFLNENGVPTLYLQPGQGLENAAAQGAMWYPIPQNYAYTQPMYVALAPSWAEYTNMGWYPGMTYYGGMWGYSPYSHFSWMPGFYISVGGHRYSDYGYYHSYYTSTPGYIRNRVVYTNYNTARSVSGRSFGSTGSFNANRATGSTGSFGAGRTNTSSGTFGSRPSGGGFGSRPASSTGSFGSGRTSSGFGSGSTPAGGSFGTRTPSVSGSRPSGSSFGGGSSGFGGSSRPSGSSFGGGSSSSGRTSGSSFGGGHSSFGGGRRR